MRVDMKAAGAAIEAMGADGEPGLETLRMHAGQTLLLLAYR
jgi:hypothetical protein